MPDESGSRKKQTLTLLLMILAGAGVAGFFSLRGQSESNSQLDTTESAVAYICLDDNNVFQVTPAGFEQLLKQGQVQSGGPETGVMMLQCPKCRKIAAVRAQQCQKDQAWFSRQLRDSTPGKCPKCGGSFYSHST